MLKIHNSLTGEKEDLRPIEAGKVRIYVCGMTVYDYLHLGHARMMVVFDMVARYLRSRGYDVTYVRNITDIDDKIIRRAAENGESFEATTERFIAAMNEDTNALGLLRPDKEPRATEHIPAILDMIGRLLARGLAYQGGNGDVYFDVSAFPGYGKLSGKKPDELRAGARVEVQEAKDDPLDFVLWKAAKPGEPSWDSPWGRGRPGWHIECSAMSTQCLGNHFDIHGGGQDLQFPHHENEIAQSEGANDGPFVNVWMHNGFVRVAEEKMSKSLGNFFTVREVLSRYKPEVVRFFILSSHYRSPLNYTDENLNEARTSLARLYTALRDAAGDGARRHRRFVDDFHAAMDDDFNTPRAIAVLHEAAHDLNRLADRNGEEARVLVETLRELGGTLGLLQDDPVAFLQSGADGEFSNEQIADLIRQRANARKARNFEEADRIRDRLTSVGVLLEDSPQGTIWRRA
ncbi:MAG: cysteine--tRNA ligase [Gammaproteobacteria bacterium]|nr:cysteine--tRNA ligase [Gammaproteobacteria bacterium]